MGYALAHAFEAEGHAVLLISGPTQLDIPDSVDFIPVETAAEMHDAVERNIGRVDAAIFAAAVADYTPAQVAAHKLKKSGDILALELVKTPDILGSARTMGFDGILVGFAAETENLESNARDKLRRKGCDLVVANDVSRKDTGFDSDYNRVLLVYPDHTEALPTATKHDLGHWLVDAIVELVALKKLSDES